MWDLRSKIMLKHKHVTFEFMLISNNNVNFIFASSNARNTYLTSDLNYKFNSYTHFEKQRKT